MKIQAFTSNYADNSTEAGFQFTFYCDICRDGFKTSFIESKSYKKGKRLRGIGQAVSLGTSLLGKYGIGYHFERGSDIISERFMGMSPEWHKEHEQAFEIAQNEPWVIFTDVHDVKMGMRIRLERAGGTMRGGCPQVEC